MIRNYYQDEYHINHFQNSTLACSEGGSTGFPRDQRVDEPAENSGRHSVALLLYLLTSVVDDNTHFSKLEVVTSAQINRVGTFVRNDENCMKTLPESTL